jgi:hypothetical protein
VGAVENVETAWHPAETIPPLFDRETLMNGKTSSLFDSTVLSTFAATLTNLPKEEIQKAKKLYILNAIADFKAERATGRTFLIVLGVMCIIPIFLVVFIPAVIGYRNSIGAVKQKILNAIEIWEDDLGSDYLEIRNQIA